MSKIKIGENEYLFVGLGATGFRKIRIADYTLPEFYRVIDAGGVYIKTDDIASALNELAELRQEVERLLVVLEPICDGYMQMLEMVNGRDEEGGVPIPQIVSEAYAWLQRNKEAGK